MPKPHLNNTDPVKVGFRHGTILRWSPDTGFEEIITNFFPEDRSNALFENRHHQIFYGLGFSEHCNLLVGESVERALWEVTSNGEKIRRYRSPKHWMPTGVYYRYGKYYVLEYGFDRGRRGFRRYHGGFLRLGAPQFSDGGNTNSRGVDHPSVLKYRLPLGI